MATKKLKYEVDVDSEKAKRKLKADLASVEGAGGASSGSSAASGAVAREAEKAARSLGNLDKESQAASSGMGRLIKGFTGMAVGLATSYAARLMPQGLARDAVEIGGSVVQGASAGFSLGGPKGAAIGAVVGGAKGVIDKAGEKDAIQEDFDRAELRYKASQKTRKELMDLADIGDDPTKKEIAKKLDEVQKSLEKYSAAEAHLIESVNRDIGAGKYDAAAFNRESLGENRSMQQQLEALAKTYEKMLAKEDPKKDFRASMSASDALSRVGGDFAPSGGSAVFRDLKDINEKQLDALKEISRKTGKGGVF